MEDTAQLGLIVFAIAYTVTQLDGPFGLAKLLRKMICDRCKTDDCECTHNWEWVREGMTCPICCGFWISSLALIWYPATTAYSAWGVVAVIWMWVKKGETSS